MKQCRVRGKRFMKQFVRSRAHKETTNGTGPLERVADIRSPTKFCPVLNEQRLSFVPLLTDGTFMATLEFE